MRDGAGSLAAVAGADLGHLCFIALAPRARAGPGKAGRGPAQLPFVDAVRKVRHNEAQKAQENAVHQCLNLDGAFDLSEPVPCEPVVLLDDVVDSKWTLTVVAALLRQAGVPVVGPSRSRAQPAERDVTVSPLTQAVLLLTAHFVGASRTDPKPLSPGEWGRFAQWLGEQGATPDRLLGEDASVIFASWSDPTITSDRLQFLLARSGALGLAVEKWERAGLWVLTRGDRIIPAGSRNASGETRRQS